MSNDTDLQAMGEVWTITGKTVVYDGQGLQVFSISNVEPRDGGEEGVMLYKLTKAGTAKTVVRMEPGMSVRHNVTGLTLDVRPGGKPWRALVNQLTR